MKVAFVHIGRDLWRGGYNYLLNLFAAIDASGETLVEPVLYAGADVAQEELEPFLALARVQVVRDVCFDAPSARRHLLAGAIWGCSAAVEARLRKDGIGGVFEHARFFFGWRCSLPIVAWLPDFQHRHLPGMYSRLSWLRREIGYQLQIRSRKAVVLSSEDARRDCERFYPCSRDRIRVVRFATRVPEAMIRKLGGEVAVRYGLKPGRYFFFPSQFYRHKNHALVIRALARLKRQGIALEVAFSGEKDSLRSRGLVDELRALAAASGVSEQVRFLGNVPYADLLALMRHARAMLNPSLFEGWSTVVEEARSLGVPMLLSDLAVHREQMGEGARYFDRHSPDSLANAMRDFPSISEGERQQRLQQALQDVDVRVRAYGRRFQHTVREALGRPWR